MIRTLIAAASLTALAGIAIAQPAGRGPERGFGLLALDANADGKVERAEVLAAQKTRFDAIDSNRDGQAAPEEFKAFHEQARAAGMQEMATRRFAELDKDANGQISKTEFTAGMQAGPDLGGPDNADGHRGQGREVRMRGPGPGPGPERHGRGPDGQGQPGLRGDANSDGKVSLAEFSAHALEAFDRADTNKDGAVSIAELQAMRPARP